MKNWYSKSCLIALCSLFLGLSVTHANLTGNATITGKTGDAAVTISIGSGGTVFSGPGLSAGATIVEGQLDSNVSKEHDIKALIIGWTNFLFPVAAVLAVLAVVWAGFLYITAFGDDGRMENAKKIIIWVIIGILVIAAAYAIVRFVMEAAF